MSNTIIAALEEKIASVEEISDNIIGHLPYYSSHNDVENLIGEEFGNHAFLHSIRIDFEINDFPFNYKYIRFSRENDSITIARKDLRPPARCPDKQKALDSLLKINNSGWTEPYRCTEDTEIVVAYVCPITETLRNRKQKTLGWISFELSLHFLNQLINGIKLGETGYVFMVSKEGTYISHPDQSKLYQNYFTDASQKVNKKDVIQIRNLVQISATGSFIDYPEKFGYKKSKVLFTSVRKTGWMLFFVLQQSELYRELNSTLKKMILVSLFGVILVLILINLITKRFIRPITNVASELNIFSSDEQEYLESVRNEAEALSRSLSRLKARYHSIIETQEKYGLAKEKLDRDLIQASEIQKSIIKTQYPAFPDRNDLDIHSVFHPAQIISGDLYDYFFIDRNNLLFAIGDVSGKGIPAALFMSVAHTLMRADVTGMAPNNIVSRVNNELCSTNRHQFFLTLFLGILNLENGSLRYCNAGHTNTLILKKDGLVGELTESHGLPLGIYSERNYETSSVIIQKGDIVVLYTDGVTETSDPAGNHYGINRLKSFISNMNNNTSFEINEKIVNDLNQFRSSAHLIDDISLLTIKFKP